MRTQQSADPNDLSRTTVEPGCFATNGWGDYSWSTDEMEVVQRSGLFAFEINEPWAGDTESGFGQRCDLTLSSEQAKALADWIYAELARAA